MKRRMIGQSGKCRRRGSALLECVMIVPFVATIVSLTYFFGWAMRNQQQVFVSDRYLAWRSVRGAGWRPDESLNEFMFDNRAGNIHQSGGDGPDDTRDDLIEATDERDRNAGVLAETAVNQWPGGRSTSVSVSFPTDDGGLWTMFKGSIPHTHAREGVEWRRGQVSYLKTIRDKFLINLHSAVSNIPDGTLQSNLKALYEKRW